MAPVNEIEARIRRLLRTHTATVKDILAEFGYSSLEDFVYTADTPACARMVKKLDEIEGTPTGQVEGNSLHREPERDGFKHESPIRAFTDWSVQGDYAIGKGFRPSLQHVVTYLDAMERKEGWRIVQILEAGSQTPSFLFRCVREVSDVELKARHPLFDPVMPELGEAYQRKEEPVRCRDPECSFANGPRHYHLNVPIDSEEEPKDTVEMEEFGTGKKVTVDLDQYRAAHPSIADYWNQTVTIDGVTIPTHCEPPAVDLTRHRISRASPAMAAPYEAPADWQGDPYKVMADMIKNDPVNPKHYKGTGCAEIIENLPGNLAHAITYIWRAGDKPDQPECPDIDKALWFLNREQHLANEYDVGDDDESDLLDGQRAGLHWHFKRRNKSKTGEASDTPDHWFFRFAMDRIPEDMPDWRSTVIMRLVIYALLRRPSDVMNAILQLQDRKTELECGRGLAI